MFEQPKTLKEAQNHRYSRWAGNEQGAQYDEGYCAYEVYSGFIPYQCSRKNGHGSEGLYCWQHARIVEKSYESD